MKLRTFLSPLLSIAVTTAGTMLAVTEGRADPVGGQVLIPDTSIEHSDHIGHFAHTNTKVLVLTGVMDNVHPPSSGGGPEIAPGPSYLFETPASLGCVYRLTSVSSAQIGCSPTDTTLPNPSGGAKAIAIVDAYDYPRAFSDLQIFSAQFLLPAPTAANFQVVYATGTRPKADSGPPLHQMWYRPAARRIAAMQTAICRRSLLGRRPAAARASSSLAHPTNLQFPKLSATSGGTPTWPPTRTRIPVSGSMTSPIAAVGAL